MQRTVKKLSRLEGKVYVYLAEIVLHIKKKAIAVKQ